MTVIAWDGEILAVDRQITQDNTSFPGTKMVFLRGKAITWTNRQDVASLVLRWFKHQRPEDWPKVQETEAWSQIVYVDRAGECWTLESYPIPLRVECQTAWGSGADIALGALLSGKNAIDAVLTANRANIHCGFGVTYYHPRYNTEKLRHISHVDEKLYANRRT